MINNEAERQTDPESDRSKYPLKPIIIDASQAHEQKNVQYDQDWTVHLRHPSLPTETAISVDKQFVVSSGIMADTSKPLADTDEAQEISEQFSNYYNEWMQLSIENFENGIPAEINWGTYVYDIVGKDLYHFPPKEVHRSSLLPSNMAFFDKGDGSSVKEVLERLQSKVVGFAGVSVGGNMVEGWVRNVRPNVIKMADGDTPEASNFNRLMRGSFRSYLYPRSERADPGFPFGDERYKKVHSLARELHLVDPYMDEFVYDMYLNESNIDQFLLGNDQEPPIDILVEEIDDIHVKIKLREYCRQNKIPVVMASDFGSLSVISYWDFATYPEMSIAKGLDDENFYELYQQLRQGGKKEVRMLVEALCGVRFKRPENYNETPEENALYQQMNLIDLPEEIFSKYLYGTGKQIVSSIPQLGSTALLAGGAGGDFLVDWGMGREMPETMIVGLRSIIK